MTETNIHKNLLLRSKEYEGYIKFYGQNKRTKFYLPDWTPAFKGMDKDMTSKGHKFAIGSVASKDENTEIEVCSSGFHSCGDILSINAYYEIYDVAWDTINKKYYIPWNKNNNRFFNVSIRGNVDFDDTGSKFAAQHLRVDSEIDMTNGTFKTGNNFIKVVNNKVHCVDGPAMSINGVDIIAEHGFIESFEYSRPGVSVNYYLDDKYDSDASDGIVRSIFNKACNFGATATHILDAIIAKPENPENVKPVKVYSVPHRDYQPTYSQPPEYFLTSQIYQNNNVYQPAWNSPPFIQPYGYRY